MLDDQLALLEVNLFLVHLVGVDTEIVGDHLTGGDRAHGSAAVHADHHDIVKVDLLALRELVETHDIAALCGHGDLLRLRPVKVLLDELGQKERSAVERSGRKNE